MALQTKRLLSKRVQDLSDTEFQECSRLNYGTSGEMWYRLNDARRESIRAEESQALMIRDRQGKLIAWALLFKDRYCRSYEVHFYVPQKYRRQGLGTKLVDAVKRREPKAMVKPWNKASKAFFENFPNFSNA